MSGLCSAHQDHVSGCLACEAKPEDLFPDWQEMLAEAHAAGKHTCDCGFEFYKTTNICPLCGKDSLIWLGKVHD